MLNIRVIGKVVAWTAVGVVATAGVAGAATEMNHSSSTSTIATDAAASPAASSTATGAAGRHHRGAKAGLRALLGTGEYGSVTYQLKGKDVTLDAQRGVIGAISATGFTVTSVDGHVETYVVSAKTRVATGTGKAAAGTAVTGFSSGADVTVVAVQDGSTETALLVRPARVKKAATSSATSSASPAPSASSTL